jgi:hypothetical protein
MIRDTITIQDMVDLLNKIAQDDPKAMRTLSLFAFECNEELAKADYITLSRAPDGRTGVGVAALIGAIFGRDEKGNGPILMMDTPGGGVSFTQEAMPTDPDVYAKERRAARMKGFDVPDYTIDEKRVVKYLNESLPDVGAGPDPIGFLMASHAALSAASYSRPASTSLDAEISLASHNPSTLKRS